MPIIYDVIIESTEKENQYHITWHNTETNTVNSFEKKSEITLEESQRLSQWQRCQLSIGKKPFRFMDSDNRHFQQALDRANQLGEPLQIHLRTNKQTEDWPFELLATPYLKRVKVLSKKTFFNDIFRSLSFWLNFNLQK